MQTWKCVRSLAVAPFSLNLYHSFTPQPFYSRTKCLPHSLSRRLCGPQRLVDDLEKRWISFSSGIGPLFLGCPSSWTTHQLRNALFCVITQRVMVISCRRFGTTYRSHLQGSSWSLHALQRRCYEHVDMRGVCAIGLESLSVPLWEPQI